MAGTTANLADDGTEMTTLLQLLSTISADRKPVAGAVAALATVATFFPAGTEDGLPVDPGLIFSGEATPSPLAAADTPVSVSSFQRPRGGVRGASYGSLD